MIEVYTIAATAISTAAPIVIAVLGGFKWLIDRQDVLHIQNREIADAWRAELIRRLERLEDRINHRRADYGDIDGG